ncbi:unnamed protein product [Parascedosporium putredinis]|uniref:Uncharacterized protein n=1 Tax=Parascedosporium putredinis TaxID=1442378 RepID=A0A9P1M5L6_9PEZI|nr:unnamed protein product [Parascedosporium putredinis]CAI7987400.1 unnamed protein product [Parascedosporium putredinis]
MADPKIDIQNLLQTGSFPTGRTRTSERGNSSESLERTSRSYGGSNGQDIDDASFQPTKPEPPFDTLPRPRHPPWKTSKIPTENTPTKSQVQGDIDQHPVILENEDYQYAHNPEQRFVLVTDPTAPAANEPVVNDRKNTEPVEQRFVLGSTGQEGSCRGEKTDPGVKEKATGGVPAAAAAAAAVAAASKLSPSSSSKDAKPSAANRRKSPHDLPRLDTEGADGRESRRRPRHMRSRSSTSAYDDYRSYEPQSPTHGGRPAQDDFLSPEVIKHGPRNREQVYHPSGSRPQPAKQKERFTEERPDGPSFNRGPRSISPGPKRSRPGSELPSKHTSRRSSRGSPPRPETLRVSDAPSSRRNPRKTVVVHDERASTGNLLAPSSSRHMTGSRSRSKSTTAGAASPNLYADSTSHPGPRMNFHGGGYWDPRPRPRDTQGFPPGPIQITGPSGPREPLDSSRSRYARSEWQHSPPRNQTQASSSNPFMPSSSRPGPAPAQSIVDVSVREYFDDPRRHGLLPYRLVLGKSPMGTSLWYPIAWFFTMKDRLPDVRLLTGIATTTRATTEAGQECPGSQRGARVWNTIKDPITRRAIPNFNVCYECTMIIEFLLPNLRGILVLPDSTSQTSTAQCSMHPSPDRQVPVLYFDALEHASDTAITTGGAPKLAQLAEDISAVSSRVVRRGPSCTRDNPMQNQRWYIMDMLPELTVCNECFEDFVYPRLSESPSLTEQFSMYLQRLPVGTCQLYSDRMRILFDETCRRRDTRLLEDAVIERKNREVEVQAKLNHLRSQPQGDPWVDEATKKLEMMWKRWE